MLRMTGFAARLLILLSLATPVASDIEEWEDYVSKLDKEGLRKYLLSWEVRCDKTEFEKLVTRAVLITPGGGVFM